MTWQLRLAQAWLWRSAPILQVASVWIWKVVGMSGTWCFWKVLLYCINNRGFYGFRLNVPYFLLFVFPHCLLLAPSVHAARLLLGNKLCCGCCGCANRENSTPGHEAQPVPERDTWWGSACWTGMCLLLCVHTGHRGLWWNLWQVLCRAHSMMLEQLPSYPWPLGSTHWPRSQQESQC